MVLITVVVLVIRQGSCEPCCFGSDTDSSCSSGRHKYKDGLSYRNNIKVTKKTLMVEYMYRIRDNTAAY